MQSQQFWPAILRHRFYSGLEDNLQIVDDALCALYAAGYWHARRVLLGSDVVTWHRAVCKSRNRVLNPSPLILGSLLRDRL